jgi:uncharacterized protein YbjT (DUF2867 family)
MSSIMILGATGLVGQDLLRLALADPAITRVVAPTRRALPAQPKLDNPLVDFEHLSAAATWWQVDAVLCALGSTIKLAGSQAAFYRVDHDYVLTAAKLARATGAGTMVLNSSLGANLAAGSFYLRVKAETERDLQTLGFASLTLVRPSLLAGGPRPDSRPGESVALALGRLLGPLVPKRVRPVATAKVAQAMLKAALTAMPGVRVLESAQLQ